VGRSSMEVRIDVVAQDLFSGRQTHTNTAYFVYVALDQNGRPAAVPRLLIEGAAEQRQWEAAQQRQAYRLEQRRLRQTEDGA
jgi:acyl-CoA hydrolase